MAAATAGRAGNGRLGSASPGLTRRSWPKTPGRRRWGGGSLFETGAGRFQGFPGRRRGERLRRQADAACPVRPGLELLGVRAALGMRLLGERQQPGFQQPPLGRDLAARAIRRQSLRPRPAYTLQRREERQRRRRQAVQLPAVARAADGEQRSPQGAVDEGRLAVDELDGLDGRARTPGPDRSCSGGEAPGRTLSGPGIPARASRRRRRRRPYGRRSSWCAPCAWLPGRAPRPGSGIRKR